ncbi:MAG: cysteine desulfurase family protein [Planctomycetota bacterium]
MRIYLDHNATTPLRPEVRERWLEVHAGRPGNPSSPHASGRRARDWVDRAREEVARALGVEAGEILFTSGGTEANNLALAGVLAARGAPAATAIVTPAAEHSSVLAPAAALAARGHPWERVGVDAQGRPDVRALAAAARRHPGALVSVGAANNEVGSVAPLGALPAALRAAGAAAIVHTDAVQALGRLPLALREWEGDLASFSTHKVGGPPGIGILWCRAGTPLAPLFHGGGQEHGRRAGTEDVAGIAAGALAVVLAVAEQGDYRVRVGALARTLWAEVSAAVPGARLLGPPIDAPERLPNTLCVLFPGEDGRMLVTRLDLDGLEVSAGSACASGSLEPSHVLLAMGLDAAAARAALRLSLGRDTTRAECTQAVEILRKAVCPSRAT